MCTMTKQDLRKEFLARRARIDAKNHREWSGHMAEEVLSYVAKQKITKSRNRRETADDK